MKNLRNFFRVIAATNIMLLVACGDQGQAQLAKRLETAEQEVSAVKIEIAALKEEMARQKQGAELAELINNLNKFAYLTPGADGYSVISYDLGVLTLQLDDIKPYANGSKIALRIGNPMFTSINGLKMKIDWGKVDATGTPINEQAKSKTITLSQVIREGRWNTVPFVLDGVAPAELGFVRISEVSHTGINLLAR